MSPARDAWGPPRSGKGSGGEAGRKRRKWTGSERRAASGAAVRASRGRREEPRGLPEGREGKPRGGGSAGIEGGVGKRGCLQAGRFLLSAGQRAYCCCCFCLGGCFSAVWRRIEGRGGLGSGEGFQRQAWGWGAVGGGYLPGAGGTSRRCPDVSAC